MIDPVTTRYARALKGKGEAFGPATRWMGARAVARDGHQDADVRGYAEGRAAAYEEQLVESARQAGGVEEHDLTGGWRLRVTVDEAPEGAGEAS